MPDGRLLLVHDGNVYAMAATPGADHVLLADLPWGLDQSDARGA